MSLIGDRYSVVRPLGAGGMGTVYEAQDTRAGRRVALKSLTHLDPAGLYRFKNEFRSLAATSALDLAPRALHSRERQPQSRVP